MDKIRNFIKKLLPNFLLQFVGEIVVRHRSKRLAGMTVRNAFNEIYRKKMWQQGASLSGLGSEGKWAEDYLAVVGAYLNSVGARSVVDAGCGDFSIGSRIAPNVDSYIGLDISSFIVNRNRELYSNVNNVEFHQFDLINDPLPNADVLLVRQVLQHLSNKQIESALQNIEASGIKRILITEHSMKADTIVAPNLDLKSHSVATRISLGSGVDIGKPPFSRPRQIICELEPGPENGAEKNSVLTVFELAPGEFV